MYTAQSGKGICSKSYCKKEKELSWVPDFYEFYSSVFPLIALWSPPLHKSNEHIFFKKFK